MTRLRNRIKTLVAAYRRLLRTPLDGGLSPAARRRQAGYNLVEIMIVMAIIGMLMSAAGFGGFAMLERSRRKETRRMMHTIEQALVTWQAEDPKDGWGRPFQFKCPGEHNNEIDLISLGKDGKEGTTDDIKSWEEEETKK
jgi:general secretion pathway protein G